MFIIIICIIIGLPAIPGWHPWPAETSQLGNYREILICYICRCRVWGIPKMQNTDFFLLFAWPGNHSLLTLIWTGSLLDFWEAKEFPVAFPCQFLEMERASLQCLTKIPPMPIIPEPHPGQPQPPQPPQLPQLPQLPGQGPGKWIMFQIEIGFIFQVAHWYSKLLRF